MSHSLGCAQGRARHWSAHRVAQLLLVTLLAASPTFARGATPDAAVDTTKNVLLLFPHQSNWATSALATTALREEFGAASDVKPELFFEFLDLNRFGELAEVSLLLDLLTARYHNRHVDLVIVQSPRMLTLWLENRSRIAPKAPVVYFDVAAVDIAGAHYPADVTGVTGIYDFARSLRWMMQADPSVREFALVYGVGEEDRRTRSHVAALQREMKGEVVLTDLSHLSFEQIKERAAALPATSAILYFPFFEDTAGAHYHPSQALRALADVSLVPILTGFDPFVGSGTIGGYMYSIAEQAGAAARIGLRILRGERPESIPPSDESGNRYFFDQSVLDRFNIPVSALPPDSVIHNRQISIWEAHRVEIITVAVGFSLLMSLVALLAVSRRRLAVARESLRRSNSDLEAKVVERTAALERQQHFVRLVTDNIPNLVAYWNADLRCEFANARYLEYFGRSAEAMRGIHLREMMGETLFAKNEAYVRAVLRGEPQDFQRTLIKVDGSTSHTYTHYLPDRDGDQVKGFFVTVNDVTPIKRAELQLRYLETIVESSHEAILSADTTDLVTSWNRGAVDTFGYSPAEIIGQPLSTICAPDHRREQTMILDRLRQGESFEPIETQCVRRDGSVLDVSMTLSPVRDVNDVIVGASCVARDISAKKRAEAALLASEQVARTTLDAVPEHICVIDRQGVIIAVNQAWRDFYSRNSESAAATNYGLGTNYLDICSGAAGGLTDGAPEIAAGIRAVMAGRLPRFTQEYPCHSPTEERVFLARVTPFHGDSGNILISHENITERKVAADRLRESEARYRLLAENGDDIIWTIDPESLRYTYISPSVLKRRGFTPEECMAQPIAATLTPPSVTSMYTALAAQLVRIAGGDQSRLSEVIEVEAVHRDGRIIPVEVATTYILDSSGKLTTILGVTRDITERRRAQQALEHLAHTDTLTGMPNRRHFMDLVTRELNRTVRYGGEFSLLMMDLDHFKQVNDTHGHRYGDLVLQTVASVCNATLREIDVVGRVGGEEFAVMLPQTDSGQALVAAERLRMALAAAAVRLPDGSALHVTASIGVASLKDAETNLDTLLALADRALYEAKNGGRNQVRAHI